MPTYISRLTHRTFFWLFIWREELFYGAFYCGRILRGWTLLVGENVRALVSKKLYWTANFSIHTNSRTSAAGATKKFFFFFFKPIYFLFTLLPFFLRKYLASWSDLFFLYLKNIFLQGSKLNSETFAYSKVFAFLNFSFCEVSFLKIKK